MIDRTVSPPYYKIKKCQFPVPNYFELVDSVPIYSLSMGIQNVVQLEIVLGSGAFHETKPGLAYITGNMLLEGTEKRNFKQIADFIDRYGASIDIHSGFDFLTISLSCTTSFLPQMLEILEELFREPAFDPERLEHLKNLKKQHLLMENAKTDKVAKKKLRSMVFSDNNSYGHILSENDINSITIDDVKDFYATNLFVNAKIFVSGLLEGRPLGLIMLWAQGIASLSKLIPSKTNISLPDTDPTSESITMKDNTVQASICIGKRMPLKTNEEFIDISLVNTVLGGYFGSRLMKNIREVHGYTYGIYSHIATMQHASLLIIAADVADEYLSATLEEISKEVKKLQSESVHKNELKTLKNYLMGNLKNDMDNPLVVMDRFKSICLYGLDEMYYENLYEDIYNLDEDRVQEVAKKYFDIETMSKVVVK